MNIRTFSRCALSCLCLLLTGQAGAQPFFEDTGDLPSSAHFVFSPCMGDYDNDGRLDMVYGVWDGVRARNILAHNEGHGRFADASHLLPPDLLGGRWGDWDNDGDLDLLIKTSDSPPVYHLLRNERGKFVDERLETINAAPDSSDNGGMEAWIDFDRDGRLDLFSGDSKTEPGAAGLDLDKERWLLRSKLYLHREDGALVEVTEQAGLKVLNPGQGGGVGGLAAADFDDDGWPDLYVAVNLGPNHLFLNNGQGGFREVLSREIADPGTADGAAIGDINGDGLFEIFRASPGYGRAKFVSSMLLNLGQGQFLSVTEGVGLAELVQIGLMGSGLADIDNDGDVDLLTGLPHFLFLNKGDGTFVNATDRSGVGYGGSVYDQSPVVFGDYDLDGFVDVFVGLYGGTPQARWFRNRGGDLHWLEVELVGTRSNRSGIGARLEATSGEQQQVRQILGSRNGEQDELVAHFGLGTRTKVDRLEVRWPSGQVDMLTDIPADQRIRVFEGRESFHQVRPTEWESAPPGTLAVGSTLTLRAAVSPALYEPGALITSATVDLSAWGGPAAWPLVDQGNGTWSLEAALKVEGPYGFRELPVLIDQTSSLGPYWTRLSRTLLVAPAQDEVVFDEGEGWQVQAISGATLNPQATALVYAGAEALEVKAEAFTLKFAPAVPVNPVGYQSLRFAFHPGDAKAGTRGAFNVVVNQFIAKPVKLLGGDLKGVGIDMEKKDWQVVEIPLEIFGVQGSIEEIRLLGNLRGTFYLDDIRLVAATPPPVTVVEEERTAALPQSFSLAQNFPNPFNGDTVIRFALPEGGEVELAVYNLAGQQVVRLAEGVREAGSYTVRWDGRDEQEKELASGVYLYRLRAGEQVETRKLVLVR